MLGLDVGVWILVVGFWTVGSGCWMLDGLIVDFELWMLDLLSHF